MKTIEIKVGNKITYKIVPDNYEETDDTICRDMTTSGRKSIGFTDIPKERWDSIFKKDETEYLLASEANKEHLEKSIKEADEGNLVEVDI